MDQLRTLEFVQLQAFARVLQQQNKKYVSLLSISAIVVVPFSCRSQSTIDKLRQQNNRIPPAQLLAESIKVLHCDERSDP